MSAVVRLLSPGIKEVEIGVTILTVIHDDQFLKDFVCHLPTILVMSLELQLLPGQIGFTDNKNIFYWISPLTIYLIFKDMRDNY